MRIQLAGTVSPLILFTTLLFAVYQDGKAGYGQQPPYSYPSTSHSKDALLTLLRPALRTAREDGRVYYGGTYPANTGEIVPFPVLQIEAPPTGDLGLVAVRDIFRAQSGVTIGERPGIIAVTIGDPTLAVLSTKIRMLSLTPVEQYNPTLAINAIEATNEVGAGMQQLRFKTPQITLSEQLVTQPARGLPHLPPSMKDLTLDQALDSVARTFKGIVFYGACEEPSGDNLMTLEFASGARD